MPCPEEFRIPEMDNKPLVSVIMPFLNAEKFIEEAIESELAQTYDNWELLLVDDGSTDKSRVIALQYAKAYPNKVRYLEHKGHQNRGASASRNLGIHHAQGEYIAFLDADDVLLPKKFEEQVLILNSQPEAAMVYGATQFWYSWTGIPEDINRDFQWDDFGVKPDTLVRPLTLLYNLLRDGSFAPCLCSFLVRHEAIERIAGFEESFKYIYTDQVFYAKLVLNESVFVSSGCWERYRQHPHSCCHIVERRGESASARLTFLKWLENYLSEHGFKNTEVWEALQEQLRPYRHISNRMHPIFYRVLVRAQKLLKWKADINSGHIYEGFLDRADCSQISGWAWDKNKPAIPVYIDIYDDSSLLAVIKASEFRNDLLKAGKGDGRHAFTYIVPSLLKDGKIHLIRAKVTGTNFDLINSPKEIDCKRSVTKAHVNNLSRRVFRRLIALQILPIPLRSWLQVKLQGEDCPPVGRVQFGSLRRVTPISRDWGANRGLPVDRYYIEDFLSRHSDDIQGNVLEIGDDSYTRKFGSDRVEKSDVLNLMEGNPKTTIVADLASAPHILSNSFDCIICIQTLQYIYDVRSAVKTLYRILKPGGVLLVTLPGISQTSDYEWGDYWCWNFTSLSGRKLFEEIFPKTNVMVRSYGNVLAAISFLYGLAVEELSKAELDYRDQGYDVIITVRAIRPNN